MKTISLTIAGIIVVIVIILTLTSWYTIDQGEVGVLLTNGAVTSVEDAGFHFKIPFFQSVVPITTQSHYVCWQANNSDCGGPMDTYSSDQQDIKIQASVNYHVAPGQEAVLYARYGSVDNMVYRTIDQYFPAISKDVFGRYSVQESIQNRAKLNSDILAAMQEALKEFPVVIESVQITDIKATPEYEASIEAKQQAAVQVQQQQELLDQEKIKAQIAVTKAQGLANSQVAQATAEAKAIELKGNADAEAIAARGKALQSNPNVVQLLLAQEWNGVLPVTMMGNSPVPFINVPTTTIPTSGTSTGH